MEKITKKQMYEAMKAYFTGEDTEVDVQLMYDFCNAQIEDLNKKAAKARERAQAKKAEADELTDVVFGVLTDEYQTIADITEAVVLVDGYAETSASKITARLTKLINAEAIEKTQVTTGEGKDRRKVMAYRVIAQD